MTRKDYELIAEVFFCAIADSEEYPDTESIMLLARGMANVLAEDNPRFEVKRFLKDCGAE